MQAGSNSRSPSGNLLSKSLDSELVGFLYRQAPENPPIKNLSPQIPWLAELGPQSVTSEP